MACETCGTSCGGDAMWLCVRCGFGCYSGLPLNQKEKDSPDGTTQRTGGTWNHPKMNMGSDLCSQTCASTTCVGECSAGGSVAGISGYRCQKSCASTCDDTGCSTSCIGPANYGVRSNTTCNGKETFRTDCGTDNGCNIQCAKKTGTNNTVGGCNGRCEGWCNQSCSGFTDNKSGYDKPVQCTGILSDTDLKYCINNCMSTCWDSCLGSCSFSCKSSTCRLLCSELQEYFQMPGHGCASCDDKCDNGSGGPGSKDPECSTCYDTCIDSCSTAGSCDSKCMNDCEVLCDDGCSTVCINTCDDHCNATCTTACAGCDDYCTACDQSCQDACIVTCYGQCASCRQSCTGQATDVTQCGKLCRSCTDMCIDTCVDSCITWNSSGPDGEFVSNATNNDWRGFRTNDAPLDGQNWYGPLDGDQSRAVIMPDPTLGMARGGFDPDAPEPDFPSAPSRNWRAKTSNLYPYKTNVPYGYGLAYKSNYPYDPGEDGSREDYTDGHGEQEWYHTTERPDDDVDWDRDHGL